MIRNVSKANNKLNVNQLLDSLQEEEKVPKPRNAVNTSISRRKINLTKFQKATNDLVKISKKSNKEIHPVPYYGKENKKMQEFVKTTFFDLIKKLNNK